MTQSDHAKVFRLSQLDGGQEDDEGLRVRRASTWLPPSATADVQTWTDSTGKHPRKQNWSISRTVWFGSRNLEDRRYVKAYAEKRQFDQAIADYTEAIRLNPEYAIAYYNRGVTYQRKDEQAKAEADIARARERGYEPE